MDSDFTFPGCSNDLDRDVKAALQKVYNIKSSASRPFFTTNINLIENPISFSNLIYGDKDEACSTQNNRVKPWEICAVHMNNIEFPWLVEDPEVVTPFCHPQSFLNENMTEFRHRLSPTRDVDSDSDNDSFLNSEILKRMENVNAECQTSRISTISETKQIKLKIESSKTDDISLLKKRVCKALEDAMRTNSSKADLKILIKFNKSSDDLSTSSSIESRVSASTENESSQSSSSKENYFFGTIPSSAAAQAKLTRQSNIVQEKHAVFQSKVKNITASSSLYKKKIKKKKQFRNLPEVNGNVIQVNKKRDANHSKDIQFTPGTTENCPLASKVIPDNEVPKTVSLTQNELTDSEPQRFPVEENKKNGPVSQTYHSVCLKKFLEEKHKRCLVDRETENNSTTANHSAQEVLIENQPFNCKEKRTEITYLPKMVMKGPLIDKFMRSIQRKPNRASGEEQPNSFDEIEVVSSGPNKQKCSQMEVSSSETSSQESSIHSQQEENTETENNSIVSSIQETFFGDSSPETSQEADREFRFTDEILDDIMLDIKIQKRKNKKIRNNNRSSSRKRIAWSSSSVKRSKRTKSLPPDYFHRKPLVKQSNDTSGNQSMPCSSTASQWSKTFKRRSRERTKSGSSKLSMVPKKSAQVHDTHEETKPSEPKPLSSDDDVIVINSSQESDYTTIEPIAKLAPLLQKPFATVKPCKSSLPQIQSTQAKGTNLSVSNSNSTEHVALVDNKQTSVSKEHPKSTTSPQTLPESSSEIPSVSPNKLVTKQVASSRKTKKKVEKRVHRWDSDSSIEALTYMSFKEFMARKRAREKEREEARLAKTPNKPTILKKSSTKINSVKKTVRFKDIEVDEDKIRPKLISPKRKAKMQQLKPVEKPAFARKVPLNIQNAVEDSCSGSSQNSKVINPKKKETMQQVEPVEKPAFERRVPLNIQNAVEDSCSESSQNSKVINPKKKETMQQVEPVEKPAFERRVPLNIQKAVEDSCSGSSQNSKVINPKKKETMQQVEPVEKPAFERRVPLNIQKAVEDSCSGSSQNSKVINPKKKETMHQVEPVEKPAFVRKVPLNIQNAIEDVCSGSSQNSKVINPKKKETMQQVEPVEKPAFVRKVPLNIQNAIEDVCSESAQNSKFINPKKKATMQQQEPVEKPEFERRVPLNIQKAVEDICSESAQNSKFINPKKKATMQQLELVEKPAFERRVPLNIQKAVEDICSENAQNSKFINPKKKATMQQLEPVEKSAFERKVPLNIHNAVKDACSGNSQNSKFISPKKNATMQQLEPVEKSTFEEKLPLNIQNDVEDACSESSQNSNLQSSETDSLKDEIKTDHNVHSLPFMKKRGKKKRSLDRMKRLEEDDGLFNVRVILSPVELALKEQRDYTVGTFVWAAISGYPYWPAIICEDPVTQKHISKGKHKKKVIKYHVRFFGDAGRRAWVHPSHLMMYCSPEDLEMLRNKFLMESKDPKRVKNYTVPRLYRKKWNLAVEELEMNKCNSYRKVMKFLARSCSSSRKQKAKSNAVSKVVSPDTSAEVSRATPAEISADTPAEVLPDTSAETLQSKDKDENFDKSGNTMKEMCSVLPTPDNSTEINVSNVLVQDELLSEMANISSSSKIQEIDVPSDRMQGTAGPSDAERSLQDSVNSPRRSGRSLKSVQRINMQELREIPSVTDIGGNSENISVTEGATAEGAHEKKEDSPRKRPKVEVDPHMYTFKYQKELHKRNNLFNGLRNTKVCDYCFKQGELFKCKGRCGLFFHLDCASRVDKPLISTRNRKKNALKTAPNAKNENCLVTRRQNQSSVEIVTIKTKNFSVPISPKEDLPENYSELSVTDQIDLRMQALMSKYDGQSTYHNDSTDSEASSTGGLSSRAPSEESILSTPDPSKIRSSDSPISTACSDGSIIDEEEKSSGKILTPEELLQGNAELLIPPSTSHMKHVTADSHIVPLPNTSTPEVLNIKCAYCLNNKEPPCFVCGLEVSRRGETTRQKCTQNRCGRFYHPGCLKNVPQTKWAIGKCIKGDPCTDYFTCPTHACHTCYSEDLGSAFAGCRLPGDKIARCLLCPAAFHTSTFCIPAGTEVFGASQIICPKHRTIPVQPINTIWCFICAKGGNLICCENCPTSVHLECQPNLHLDDDDRYICEDCESGRFPLYDEIVWAKLGHYPWWPAVILFPNEIPTNVFILRKHRGDFAVRFFGTNDYYWANKGRVFLFQEDDKGGSPSDTKLKKKSAIVFEKAVADAKIVYKLKKEFKVQTEALCVDRLKPPPYVKINKNKPVGNVKSLELNLSNATACDCDPSRTNPCGPDSSCINRLLLTECDPQLCRAGERCGNQSFQKRIYPPLTAYSTQGRNSGRGWGLKCLGPIKKGQFIIEYVGELIDTEEYQRRIQQMHEKKEENYYFMTVDSERVIDAGPKGNLSRFMNHSCNPNCITQKWTVKGDTRVGIFSKYDIQPDSELTFNYNLAVVGQEKKPCKCGASNCSGFIGVKPEKAEALPLELRKSRKSGKKRTLAPSPSTTSPSFSQVCFKCNKKNTDITCVNKACLQSFHLQCVNLDEMPDASTVSKFSCPRHNCAACSNRTQRCCSKCMTAFCPSHAEGKIRRSNSNGYVCTSHDPEFSVVDRMVKTVKRKRTNETDETVSSTTEEIVNGEEASTSHPPSKYKKSDYCYEDLNLEDLNLLSSSPLKYLEDESTGSSAADDVFGLSLGRRLKKLKKAELREKIRISVGSLCGKFSPKK
ncbi:uncharacterized protein LOC126749239 isoform X3 [Anthonomus grandis grandis]|uniref:uncharacterized protein LOC126749239 isoform X3 n=1 Tax=Anthonomus grandis grandis TaxID=2921223 RepID=UPI002165BE9D|nr:uncharacterized protein LOC126749239 isoform X3 [Anthonomus grandis grandis]